LSHGDEVIYDSLGWIDPVGEVTATAAWAHRTDIPHIVADLEWRRLRPWRRLIRQSLDPLPCPFALKTINAIEVEHGPHALPTSWLLIGWLATRLGWTALDGKVIPGKNNTWHFEGEQGRIPVTVRRNEEGTSEIASVRVSWTRDTRPMSATFAWVGPGRLVADTDDPNLLHRVLSVRNMDRAHLLARQLPDLSSDALFLNTLDVSQTMAKSII
jgi:glucose-6-phosphate dehydrogenase assembly protein OpcA